MFCHITIIAFSFLISPKIKVEYLRDSIKSNTIGRIVSVIAEKCHLSDSVKKELSNYFYSYYLKIKKIRCDRTKVLSCFSDLVSLKSDFLKTLEKRFGINVYRCYKKFTAGCVRPTRNKNMLNRIPERTSE